MFLYGESAVPSQQEFEFMGIPLENRDEALAVDELGDYIHTVAQKRGELLRNGDVSVFAANGLMRTITDLQQPTTREPQVISFLTAWQQMGEEPPFTSA